MDFFKVENQSGDEIEIQSPVFGYYVSGAKKMFVLSDHPPDELGMSHVFQTYLANPSEHDWKDNLYLIWFGSMFATNFLVWAKGFEDALEIAAETAHDAGMKGFFVDDAQMQEYYAEAREELGPDAEEDEVMQQAEEDLTYTESGYVPSHEWGGQDVHQGVPFGEGKDLYTAAKFVCEAYTDEENESLRYELTPNARGRRAAAHYEDYVVVKKHPADRQLRFYLYAYNATDDAWGPNIGLARGYASEREAFDWAHRHAVQRGIQDAVVARENADKSVTQIGNVGEGHRGGPQYNPNARGGALDEHAATELELFIENDYDLVGKDNSQGKAIEKNLERKIKQGKFDYEKSIDGWMYLIESGGKKYAREFASSEREWSKIFSPATRRFVAERFARHFAQEHGVRVA